MRKVVNVFQTFGKFKNFPKVIFEVVFENLKLEKYTNLHIF